MQMPDSIHLSQRGSIQTLKIDTSKASAEIALFGAHILSYCPKKDGKERLWLSEKAKFDGKSAIRGGVPICWPWFGDLFPNKQKSLPAHGYVRNQNWHLLDTKENQGSLDLSFAPDSSTGPGVEQQVSLLLKVSIGDNLSIKLITKNLDSSDFRFTTALHSYFRVDDIHNTSLSGLEGKYKDKTRQYAFFDTPEPYHFNEQTDRVHLSQAKELTIKSHADIANITSDGHDSIVVWNPWQALSESMTDMADDGYLTMLCVETASTQGFALGPGEQHTLSQIIT